MNCECDSILNVHSRVLNLSDTVRINKEAKKFFAENHASPAPSHYFPKLALENKNKTNFYTQKDLHYSLRK